MAFIPAAIGAAGSLLGGITGGKGAQKAAQIQAQSQAQALAEQQREYNTNQANFAPFISAGANALTGQQNILGLNGNDAQQAAINGIQASPFFTSQDQSGRDALLQSAAATGGLRGGNTESALYNQRSSLLSNAIQQQLASLGGLSSLGAGAAGTAGGLGQQGANNISNIYQQQGNTGASNALAQSSIFGKTTNDLSGILQNYLASNSGSTSLPGFSSTVGNTFGTLDNVLNPSNVLSSNFSNASLSGLAGTAYRY